jgi:dynein heavy chain 2
VVSHFKDWVVLGMVDVESLVETRLTEVSDWEDNFKSLKAKGREVEKLPSVIKIDCITVSTSPTKTAIDDMIQKLFDTLLNALRKVHSLFLSIRLNRRAGRA